MWFQKLGGWRASGMLRGMVPYAQEDTSAPKSRPGFVEIANKNRFGDQFGHLPEQPGDKSRAWGAKSFAALPMFEGKFRADTAQQRGLRMPTFSDYEKGTNSE